jgi:putative transposase
VFDELGVARSFSRPRVSNDNAFSEAQFKTVKYHPGYPGRFESPHLTREYFETFFEWYNHHHHHSGLAMFTPAAVYSGRHTELQKLRQAAMDDHYAKHPERYVNGPPRAEPLPDTVAINPDKPLALLKPAAQAAATERTPVKSG